jgi:peptide deformylase
VLRTPAEPVESFDKELRVLVKDLQDTLRDAVGAGLAAPQIGVGLRVFVYAVGEDEWGHFVNPMLSELSAEEEEDDEGCLSVPGLAYPTKRRVSLVARGFDMHGEPLVIPADTPFLARCFQHETDHLDGVVFIDRLDDRTRRRAMREIREQIWEAGVDGTPPPAVKVSPHPLYGRAL